MIELGDNDLDVLLTETEARRVVPLSVAWFQRKRWLGEGPAFYKLGNRVYYRKRDLLAWLNEQRVGR